MFTNTIRAIVLIILACTVSQNLNAFNLRSTQDTFNGTGKFLGPGPYIVEQDLFEMHLKKLSFSNTSDFTMPFENNGDALPNICAEYDVDEKPDGLLSSGLVLNENADMCLANVAGTDMLIALVQRDPLQGQAKFMIFDHKELLVSMDIAFDLGIGSKGIVYMPFYGRSGRVRIPYSLQTQVGMPGGTDRAGKHASGGWLQGRFGDFDSDGFLDGTLVSVGNIPLESPVFPGQPYAMIRHFVLDIPVGGSVLGNVSGALGLSR